MKIIEMGSATAKEAEATRATAFTFSQYIANY